MVYSRFQQKLSSPICDLNGSTTPFEMIEIYVFSTGGTLLEVPNLSEYQ